MALKGWFCLSFSLLIFFGFESKATADFYKYELNGKTWISNKCPRRVKCIVILKDGSSQKKIKKSKKKKYSFYKSSKKKHTKNSGKKINKYLNIVKKYSKKYQIPIPFILAVIKVESNFNPDAVSDAGAVGLMQIMPFNAKKLGVTDLYDPDQNIKAGVKLLRILANKFNGDMILVLSSYHAGGGAVLKKAGIPFELTNWYVKKVLDYYYHYKKYYPMYGE